LISSKPNTFLFQNSLSNSQITIEYNSSSTTIYIISQNVLEDVNAIKLKNDTYAIELLPGNKTKSGIVAQYQLADNISIC
jgi:hypothetical protein